MCRPTELNINPAFGMADFNDVPKEWRDRIPEYARLCVAVSIHVAVNEARTATFEARIATCIDAAPIEKWLEGLRNER